MLTLHDVDDLACQAHRGQMDKIGDPYIQHVRAVASGLAPMGEYMEMAGLLHDVLEDTEWTGDQLRYAGVPILVVAIVETVTNVPGESYLGKMQNIVDSGWAPTMVKIADNAHNSRSDRVKFLSEDKRGRLTKKYQDARNILWSLPPKEDVRSILEIVNPELLHKFLEMNSSNE